jgi:hypothetical protein
VGAGQEECHAGSGVRLALAKDSRHLEVLKEVGLQAMALNYKSLPIGKPNNK